jgi:hypothetical protein
MHQLSRFPLTQMKTSQVQGAFSVTKESAAARLNSGVLLRHFALSHISSSIMAHSFLGSAFLEENCTKRIFTFTVAAFGRHHPLIYISAPTIQVCTGNPADFLKCDSCNSKSFLLNFAAWFKLRDPNQKISAKSHEKEN